MANSGTFEDLECWQACNQLKVFIKEEVLVNFPKTERFELYSQLLRASRSATANVAEGWGRYHYKESIKFFLNARGSCAECLDHLLEANSCGYIEAKALSEGRLQIQMALRLLNGYIRYLRNSNK